ncbi:MAG: TIR domain-containing protein [Longimicrobiaceae bacterium]
MAQKGTPTTTSHMHNVSDTTSAARAARVFISYTHRDTEIASEFEKHLTILARKGEIEIWSERQILQGANWRTTIDERLESADIILFLISADFLASDYCFGREVQRAMELHDQGKILVIPVIVRPVDWSVAPFAKLQSLPRDGTTLVGSRDLDAQMAEVMSDLESILRRLDIRHPSLDIETPLTVELRIDANFDDYTDRQQEALLHAIKELLATHSTIKISRKERGSVKFRLQLSADHVMKLQQAVQAGELSEFNVVDAELLIDPISENGSQQRPSVFIGSSKEGLPIAEAIQLNLDELCEVTLWSQGFFGVGQGTLESLVGKLNDFDFAILVLTPDDMVESRGESQQSPRDNVLLELGLFIGGLGRERTFTVFDRTADLKLPSDLAGVTPATYQPHSSGNLEAALGAPSTKLKKSILHYGLRART